MTDGTWLAVVNLHAGSGRTASIWRNAEKLLADNGIEYDNRYTDCKYHATEISYNAASDGLRRFIAVGGDGTIHEVLEGIMRFVEESVALKRPVSLSDFTLAVIPIGSGNDWIRTHGITHDMEDVIRLIKDESFVKQDVVKVGILSETDPSRALHAAPRKSSYMVNIGGVGFDARICERVNFKKNLGESGKALYVNSLLYNLFHYKAVPMAVYCDGEKVYDGDCFSIALGTGKYSGGGMRQTPDAVFDDGLLDMTVIPPFPVPRIMCEAPKLFSGRLLTVKELVVKRAKSIVVLPAGESHELVEADGEIVGNIPVRFDVLSEQINVLHKFR